MTAKHKILYDERVGSQMEVLTTHPKITYDQLCGTQLKTQEMTR